MKITQSELKSLLSYDPETGVFRWLVATNGRISVNQIAGSHDIDGYTIIRVNKKPYKSHRLAWLYVYGEFPPDQIDHINMIRNDNRINNLREATKSQNEWNSGKQTNNTTGFKSVSEVRYKTKKGIVTKYRAECRVNGERYYSRLFDNPEEAYESYCAFSRLHHKEFYNSGK